VFYNLIGKTCVIVNVKHFIWRLNLNRITTKDNLKKKRVMITNKSRALCKEKEESVLTLFFLNTRYLVRHDIYVKNEQTLKQFQSSGSIIWKTMWMSFMKEIWDHKKDVMFRKIIIDGEEFLGQHN